MESGSLCNLADFCKRLRTNAVRAFPKCHQEVVLKVMSKATFHRAIHKFGPSIKSIHIESNDLHNSLLNIIINRIDNCCPRLEKLSIYYQLINGAQVHSLFSRLKVLNFTNCKFVGEFPKCPQLIKLYIIGGCFQLNDSITAILNVNPSDKIFGFYPLLTADGLV